LDLGIIGLSRGSTFHPNHPSYALLRLVVAINLTICAIASPVFFVCALVRATLPSDGSPSLSGSSASIASIILQLHSRCAGHEKYFDELRDLVAKGGKPDSEALANLRAKYDTVQLATLTTG
jgi:hypothetical protein